MEIICVGNELLIGKIINTNATWLARRATSLGISVKRITVIGDNTKEISTAINEALNRSPRFIVTTGGLGPTFDDKTMEGIAKALDRKLAVNGQALKMVKQKYETFARQGKIAKAELTPPRVKMATMPEGAKPLPNPVGTAPAAKITIGKTVLIALPGVPPEMEAIFEDSIIPLLRKEAKGRMFMEQTIYADSIMESTLAPLIDNVMHEISRVYIKSHPKGQEGEPHIELHLSTTTTNIQTGKRRLRKATSRLSDLIEKAKGSVMAAEQ